MFDEVETGFEHVLRHWNVKDIPCPRGSPPLYCAAMNASWTFCTSLLGEVSRTFAIPIRTLRPSLERAVTLGYLLCRVVDTVEDEADLPSDARDALYDAFLAVLRGHQAPAVFTERFEEAVTCNPELADHALALGLDHVMAVFDELPGAHQATLQAWVEEMAHGMRLYSHRRPGADGIQALLTMGDLERYCYFVAGTVGHMLTELFQETLPDLDPIRRRHLSAEAESFGLGLQLTNILKDITDDRARATSFIPRDVCDAAGVPVADLLEPGKRQAAHAALRPVFERAGAALDGAFAYCLALPPEATDVRLFCLLPLWMAVATLEHARDNDAQFEPERPVKIDRETVSSVIRVCTSMAGDDDALRQGYGALRSGVPIVPARPE